MSDATVIAGGVAEVFVTVAKVLVLSFVAVFGACAGFAAAVISMEALARGAAPALCHAVTMAVAS